MIAYEKNNNLLFRRIVCPVPNALLQRTEYGSSCLTSEGAGEDDEEEPCWTVASSYLANDGTFSILLSRGPYLASCICCPAEPPSRTRYITQGNEEAEELIKRVMPEAIWSVTQTYEACQALYREHDFTSLMLCR
ncbi:hypothetical protein GWK47_024598 [Chionoecetes opilio]|uniref:Uncharacterized protein n=1 Tax=Chionoecetes opilio TaxID=41210 RepID=A0A8J5CCD1_CHIOP|nr:hypothetical protein GWK47_024598 [Chionoecetes opilio]